MTEPVRATITLQMHLEVTDPTALLAWACREVVQSTAGEPALHREMSLALVRDVPGALRWAFADDPDCDPPGIALIGSAVGVD